MFKSRVRFINKDVLALLFVICLSLFLILTRSSPQINHLKFQLTSLANLFISPITWFNDILIIKEENKYLKEKLVQYNLMNSELVSYHYENIRLKEMLNFAVNQPLNLRAANVVGHDFGLPTQSITIDIGNKQGVDKNLMVMDENGLVGKVIKSSINNGLVQLITDKNYRVSIRVGAERALGLFIPTHGKYGVLEGVRKSMQLNKGEIAYTSGISEIYPSNIPVARVVSIQHEADNPFQNIIVELIADLENLDYVFIIL